MRQSMIVVTTVDVEEAKPSNEYLKESGFAKLFPFAAVSFFDKENHDGQFVHPEPKESHEHMTPEECDPCKELRELAETQAAEIEALKRHHRRHHRR